MITTLHRTLVLCFLLSFQLNLHAQVSEWINAQQGVGSEICLDQFNNSFGCGQFVGTLEIAGNSFTSAGVQDGIVVKTAPDGTVLWASVFGGAAGDYCNEIVYDGSGNVWVTGQFSGTLFAGNFTLVSAGGTDAYLVKLDAATGEIVFAERFGSAGNDVGIGIKSDALANVYVVGTYIGNFTFGNISLIGQAQHDIFLVKVNSDGTPQWGSSIKGSNFEATWSMAIDAEANTYIAGFSTSDATNFAGTVQNFGETTHFIAKFDSNGAYVWSAIAQFNGEIYGLCTDQDLNVYFTGNYDTQATFGNIQLTGVGWDEILLGKINSDGSYAWVNSYGGSGNDEGYDVECKPDGELYLVGTFEGAFTLGGTNLSAGGFAKTFVANLDSSGAIIWVIQSSAPGAIAHISKSITHNADDEVYLSGDGNTSITMGGVTSAIAGSFLIKLLDGGNIIAGEVYRDWNNDGIKDLNESGIPNVIMQLNQGPGVSVSNNQGIYEVFSGSGSQEVSIPNIPLYYTLTTANIQTADFVGLGNLDSGNDFGLYPSPGIQDLRIDITPVSSPKAGFVLVYMVTYTNVGTEAIDASVELTADAAISYVGAAPEPDFQSGQLATWNLGILEPQFSATMHVYYGIPVNMNIGDIVSTQASISPAVSDVNPLDNSMISSSEVTGPYDPNYKEVSTDTLYNVASEDWLTYIIHFQNIGNDVANTVIIVDTLSHLLNLSTMEIITSSHQPMDFSISSGHIATFRFNNIMLPDSASDPLGSMGFVKYRVKYLPSLPLPDSIVNFADIYFDYNPPIRTNSAVTYHLDGTIAVNEPAVSEPFAMYPNPAENVIYFSLNEATSTLELVNIYDVNGRLVLSERLTGAVSNSYAVNVEMLEPGMYILELLTDNGFMKSNFIKQ